MVVFYMAIIEAGIGEPSIIQFIYIYGTKALAQNMGFWYTTKWGPDVEGIWGVHDNISNYKDKYFFHPSECPGEFRPACKQ